MVEDDVGDVFVVFVFVVFVFEVFDDCVDFVWCVWVGFYIFLEVYYIEFIFDMGKSFFGISFVLLLFGFCWWF